MSATMGEGPVNFHLSLNVSNIDRAVEFYQKLFGVPPAKHRADYAKFESRNPPLTLSLEPGGSGNGGTLNHVGFRLADSNELVELQRRLELAGLSSQREEGVECCYARQTKFWLHDPDRTLWELYVLEGDIDHRGAGQALETVMAETKAEPGPATAAPPRNRGLAAHSTNNLADIADWEHRLGAEFPNPLPFADSSLREVRLRGTFNEPVDGTTRAAMFAEIVRVLAPGGRVVLHQLTTDRPFVDGPPQLPGPASVVREVPVDSELLSWVEDGGFEQVRLVKFGSGPCFTAAGAEMRETIVEAFAAGDDSSLNELLVVYKGPFRELQDDFGRTYRRGERATMPVSVWQSIESCGQADSFTVLKAQPTTRTV